MRRRYRFHGGKERFEIVTEYISNRYGRKVNRIADVAGGQGMLTKILRKKYNYEAEVIDPRGHRMKGVPGREEEFKAEDAKYYDLIVGLHPDKATRVVAKSALIKPTILIPCCNFWDQSKTLGREALLEEVEKYYDKYGVTCKRVEFPFKGPKNIGLVSEPIK